MEGLVCALLRSLGLKPSDHQIDMLFNNMDSNGNGVVEFDELVHAMLPDIMTEQYLYNQSQLPKVFHSFDTDGNGVITRAELVKSMAKIGQPLTDKELTESFGFPVPLP